MDHSYYVIDPLGDVELVVNRNEATILDNACYNAPKRPEEPILGVWSDEEKLIDQSTLTATQQDLAAAEDDEGSQTPDVGEIRILVDSKTLIRTSSYFKVMLHGDFKESQDLEKGEMVRIKTLNCQTMALIVLLDFLHTQTARIPEVLDFPTAFEIAMLVDKWLCHSAMKFQAFIWMTNLVDKVPTEYSCDLLLWLFVAWTFRDKDLFWKVTSMILRHAKSTIVNPLDISIPPAIFDAMNDLRVTRISSLLEVVQQTYARLLLGGCRMATDRVVCTCRLRLIKATDLNGLDLLTISVVQTPFNGIQLKKYVARLYAHIPQFTIKDEHCHPFDGLEKVRSELRYNFKYDFEYLGVDVSDIRQWQIGLEESSD